MPECGRSLVLWICYVFAEHETVSGKSKDWMHLRQDNVSTTNDMLTGGLLYYLCIM